MCDERPATENLDLGTWVREEWVQEGWRGRCEGE